MGEKKKDEDKLSLWEKSKLGRKTKALLSFFNMLLLKVEESSILTYLFKYHITFPIVGLILVGVGIKRGKCGSIIGKILYYIIGNMVAFVLNFISGIIFI